MNPSLYWIAVGILVVRIVTWAVSLWRWSRRTLTRMTDRIRSAFRRRASTSRPSSPPQTHYLESDSSEFERILHGDLPDP